MIVYYGSSVEVRTPKIIQTEIGRDFGRAFYTTDIQAQAERWAVRKAKIESRKRRKDCLPIVSVFEWDDSTCPLSVKQFEEPNMDWLDLVVCCRSDSTFCHGYDIVIGKIANDNVGETISYVVQGIMRKEDAVDRLRFEHINNQIAFCTEKALDSLVFVKSYCVGGR